MSPGWVLYELRDEDSDSADDEVELARYDDEGRADEYDLALRQPPGGAEWLGAYLEGRSAS